jgi:hypothetical protein
VRASEVEFGGGLLFSFDEAFLEFRRIVDDEDRSEEETFDEEARSR